MTEIDRYRYYLCLLKALPKPAKPGLQTAFCRDYQQATALIHNLKTYGDSPSLELFAMLTKLEFIIAKNNPSNLVENYLQAVKNTRTIRQQFIDQNPALEIEIKFQKKTGLELEEQIARSIYVPSPDDYKAKNRYRYIHQAALDLENTIQSSLDAQQRFRQIYSTYSTKPTKPKS